jgi:hypothetical protein
VVVTIIFLDYGEGGEIEEMGEGSDKQPYAKEEEDEKEYNREATHIVIDIRSSVRITTCITNCCLNKI